MRCFAAVSNHEDLHYSLESKNLDVMIIDMQHIEMWKLQNLQKVVYVERKLGEWEHVDAERMLETDIYWEITINMSHINVQGIII